MKVALLAFALLLPASSSAQFSYSSGGGSHATYVTNATTNNITQVTYKQFYEVTDYGAVCDTTTDDTAAIQAALEAVAASHGALYFPPGTCKITSTLALVQKSNFAVHGYAKQGGTNNTRIMWAGAAGGTMLLLDGVRDTEWSDLAFDGSTTPVEPAVIVDIDKITAGSTISRKNGFRRMLLRGGSTATVRIANTSTANNEAHIFEDVEVASIGVLGELTRYGYQIKNINAKNVQIVRGVIAGKSTAVQIDAGSIHLHSVELSGNTTWVSVGGSGEPIVIENCDGDSSRTFLEMRTATTNPVTATGNRFVQNTDGPLFAFENNGGPVTLIGNDFSSGGHRPGATTVIVTSGPRMFAVSNVFPNDAILPFPDPPTARFIGLFAMSNLHYGVGNQRLISTDILVPPRSDGGAYPNMVFGGPAGFLADVQAISTPTNAIFANSEVVTLTPTIGTTLISTPTIAVGQFDGQRVTITNLGEGSVVLQDRGTLANSGIALTANTLTLAPLCSLTFTWSATLSLWIQAGPLVVPL